MYACMHVQSLSCVQLFCLPVSSVHGDSPARTLEWVACALLKGIFQLKDRNRFSCVAGRFFITEPPGKPQDVWHTPYFPMKLYETYVHYTKHKSIEKS